LLRATDYGSHPMSLYSRQANRGYGTNITALCNLIPILETAGRTRLAVPEPAPALRHNAQPLPAALVLAALRRSPPDQRYRMSAPVRRLSSSGPPVFGSCS